MQHLLLSVIRDVNALNSAPRCPEKRSALTLHGPEQRSVWLIAVPDSAQFRLQLSRHRMIKTIKIL